MKIIEGLVRGDVLRIKPRQAKGLAGQYRETTVIDYSKLGTDKSVILVWTGREQRAIKPEWVSHVNGKKVK